MPTKSAKSRRKPRPGAGVAPATAPSTVSAAPAPAAPAPIPETAVRAQQRRRVRVAPRRPLFGQPVFEWIQRQAVASPWVGRLFAPEAPLWIAILIVIPIVLVFLDLTTGPRIDGLPYVDVDLWWHIATGNWVLDHHAVPTTDPFSWTYFGRDWMAHEWLAEMLLALLWRTWGYAGTIVATAIISVIGYWRLLAAGRYYGISRRTAVLLMLLFGGAMLRSGVLVVRPQVWTWTLLAILIAELAAYDTGHRKRLWIVPLLFPFWINMNLTALIGIGCVGAFVIDRLIRKPIDRHVVTVGVLSGLALFINAHHIKLLFLTFDYLDSDVIWRKYVFEWMSPRTSENSHIPFWIGLIAVVPALIYLIRRRPHFWPAAPLLVLAYQSYQSIRYIPIYIMLVTVFVGWLIWMNRGSRPSTLTLASRPLIPIKPWTIGATVGAAALAVLLVTTADQSQLRRNPVAWGHPVSATDYYLANYSGQRMFNTYDFGGYLIYRFQGTDNLVYIDGRAEMFGDERVRLYFDLIYGNDGWAEYLDEQQINIVMIRRIDGLSTKIDDDPTWELVYQDSANLIFARVGTPRTAT